MCYKDVSSLCELQILMNALMTIIGVIIMQLATTFQGVTTVLAILDTQAMVLNAQVNYLSLIMLILIF